MRITIAVLCALAGVLHAASEAPVALIVDATTPLPRVVELALHQEIDSIFRETGYGFSWVDRQQMKAEDSYPDLIVVKIRSACRVDPAMPASGRSTRMALGWAHRSAGDVMPFVEIDCARITRMLAGASNEEHAVGRALGRVLAHELYHVLTGSIHHAAVGVTQGALSPAHLVSPTLEFTRREISMLARRSYAARLTQPPAALSFAEDTATEAGR